MQSGVRRALRRVAVECLCFLIRSKTAAELHIGYSTCTQLIVGRAEYVTQLTACAKEQMRMQAEAERRKRAQILESEGDRQSKINVAEGDKAQVILSSEAAKQDAVNRATGKHCAGKMHGLMVVRRAARHCSTDGHGCRSLTPVVHDRAV